MLAKWYGKIGFIIHEEESPGVWVEKPVERSYYGDIFRMSRRLQSSGNLNDNIVINNQVSVVMDPFAEDNSSAIRYVEFMGTKWKVSSIEVQYPRLIMELGGGYNG